MCTYVCAFVWVGMSVDFVLTYFLSQALEAIANMRRRDWELKDTAMQSMWTNKKQIQSNLALAKDDLKATIQLSRRETNYRRHLMKKIDSFQAKWDAVGRELVEVLSRENGGLPKSISSQGDDRRANSTISTNMNSKDLT